MQCDKCCNSSKNKWCGGESWAAQSPRTRLPTKSHNSHLPKEMIFASQWQRTFLPPLDLVMQKWNGVETRHYFSNLGENGLVRPRIPGQHSLERQHLRLCQYLLHRDWALQPVLSPKRPHSDRVLASKDLLMCFSLLPTWLLCTIRNNSQILFHWFSPFSKEACLGLHPPPPQILSMDLYHPKLLSAFRI